VKIGRKCLLAGLLATALCGLAHADGVLINATNRTDMVYDHARGLIYVANGSEIERYDVVHNYPLSPIVLSGSSLMGLDLSPDGKTLAVADGTQVGGKNVVHLVNADTLVDTKAMTASQPIGQSGLFDLLYAHDGTLLVTGMYLGSGTVPFLRLDPSTLTWTTVPMPVSAGPGIEQNTMLATDAGKRTFALAESNSSDGRWDVYFPATGEMDARDWYVDGTSAFNYDVGISGDGTQFTIIAESGAFVYDASYNLLTTLGASGLDAHPIGVAYHPVDHKLYAPVAGTSNVLVYDTTTFQQIGSYNFLNSFTVPSSDIGFMGGRTRLSDDGSILMVSVTGGVRFLQLYAPLAAAPVTAASAGHRTTVALQGSIGNSGAIAYALDSQPSHGQAFVDGNTLTYVPAVGYSGTDTFTYAAYYGRAKVTSTVTVTVTADNTSYAPVVSFNTLPVLHSTTAVPGSGHVPGDFTGDGSSDLLWFNPSTSQFGYWAMSASRAPGTGKTAPVTLNGAFTFNITPGYFVGAMGDFNGDGYADLVFTSAKRDLWMWTNDQHGHWSSADIGTYPANWQLVGAADIDGDGIDDLLWLDPSDCQFAYWLMNGNVRKSYLIISIACGYYPVGVGYYSPSGTASILWSSAANDLWVWDSHTGAFSSYNMSSTLTQWGGGTVDPRYIWSFGGGWTGQGIGIEWFNPGTNMGFGGLLSRTYSAQTQTSYTLTPSWAGNGWMDKPESGGYQILGGYNGTALYVLDRLHNTIGTSGVLVNQSDFSYSGVAPMPTNPQQWTYPVGWYVIGAPSNGAQPLPWR
jgi:hypothetical protein